MSPVHDLAVIGDGPAGWAVACHSALLGLDVVLIGPGELWANTYGVWVDEIAADVVLGPHLDTVLATSTDRILAFGHRRHELARRYATIDNPGALGALRAHLQAQGGIHQPGQVRAVRSEAGHHVIEVRGTDPVEAVSTLRARQVVDAAGAGGWKTRAGEQVPARAWQTAYGVLLEALPADAAIATDLPTLMDFRPPPGAHQALGAPTFCYVIPTAAGWLVEETVLAARAPVPPKDLRSRLVARLGPQGEGLVRAAESAGAVETVRIPMGGPLPLPHLHLAPFGAAAGLIHPATGFSFSASWRAAPRVARAIATSQPPATALWPKGLQFSRRLQQYGAEVLCTMSSAQISEFFDAFFELPAPRWQAYLRVDSSPGALMATMAQMFRGAPWSTRVRLMTADPRTLRLDRR